MNLDEIALATNSEVLKLQPTLFDGLRQTMTEAFQLTAESLKIFGAPYDHWVMQYQIAAQPF